MIISLLTRPCTPTAQVQS